MVIGMATGTRSGFSLASIKHSLNFGIVCVGEESSPTALTRLVTSVGTRFQPTQRYRTSIMERIGIFGGSFDPVHLGHLWIAEAATEQLHLDRLRWIPTATQPLKPEGPVASNEQRLEMLRLAIAGRHGHEVDDREIRRRGISYTVDTVAEMRREFPQAQLFLVIGSDSLQSIRRWHEPERLLADVELAVVQRGGEEPIDFSVLEGLVDPSRIMQFQQHVIQMPLIEVSSSDIRRRVGQGRGVRHWVPRAVEAYLKANNVYGTG